MGIYMEILKEECEKNRKFEFLKEQIYRDYEIERLTEANLRDYAKKLSNNIRTHAKAGLLGAIVLGGSLVGGAIGGAAQQSYMNRPMTKSPTTTIQTQNPVSTPVQHQDVRQTPSNVSGNINKDDVFKLLNDYRSKEGIKTLAVTSDGKINTPVLDKILSSMSDENLKEMGFSNGVKSISDMKQSLENALSKGAKSQAEMKDLFGMLDILDMIVQEHRLNRQSSEIGKAVGAAAQMGKSLSAQGQQAAQDTIQSMNK